MSGCCVRLASEGLLQWKALPVASLSDERLRKAAQADSRAWFCFAPTRVATEWLFVRTEEAGHYKLLVAEEGSDAVAFIDLRCSAAQVGHFIDLSWQAWARHRFRVTEGYLFAIHEGACVCHLCASPPATHRTVAVRG